ncbi:hypothetical protein HGRIS_002114 [Hohenbuehelia grisea]|uniref:EF-hand domain-containing protein n=1 Tax=Hohenbuehelia grisea TaxID=104357 RepID=A0ABR3JKP6_9AGAR
MSSRSGPYDPVIQASPELSPTQTHTSPHLRFSADQVEDSLEAVPLSATTHPLLAAAQGPGQAPGPSTPTSYPPMAAGNARHVRVQEIPGLPYPYDEERGKPELNTPGSASPRPPNSRTPSWDILSGIKRFEHSYEEFDSRNACQAHLAFADGDIPKNKLSKLYNYLLNVSIVTRWILFIVPVLAMLWIPGILGLTKFPNAHIWNVKLLWWSIWLSVLWGGWWAALAMSLIAPSIIRRTVGLVAIGTRRYIDWMEVLHRYVALFAWTLSVWVSYNPLIDRRQAKDASENAKNAVDTVAKFLFAFYLCAAVLLFEKFSIQWIAGKFHERSYAERIADQKFAVRSLVTLYRHSSDIPGRSDTLRDRQAHKANNSINPKRFFKRAMKGVRMAATTTTTALGNVASEITGSSVLQPNSPPAMVKTALESANKSRLLARRLFYSFTKPGAEYLFVEDISNFFETPEEADRVYALFDRDSNGDASREEMEMACMEFHREQLSIEHSMRDLDSAVGRLDNILMTVYVVIAALIIAVVLETQLTSVVTGAGTAILGLSWLIGGSLQEVLTSIIFLFIKHPFDVGDRINLEKGGMYTVKEIRLLSTVFLDSNGTSVQAPNSVLNTMFIQNMRRSPQMSETFKFDVHYSTSFEALEKLRENMLTFLVAERRDYQPIFDVSVVDFPDQEKMALTVDIKYKSNFQQGSLKTKRRNKWICALKRALADEKIYGPGGNPDAEPGIKRYTEVPWQQVQQQERMRDDTHAHDLPPAVPPGGWHLSDKNAALLDDADAVYGETDELHLTNPRRGLSTGLSDVSRAHSAAATGVSMPTAMTMPIAPQSNEHIEMTRRS